MRTPIAANFATSYQYSIDSLADLLPTVRRPVRPAFTIGAPLRTDDSMRDCRLSSRSRDAIVRAWLRGLAYAFVFLACGSPSEAAQQGLQLSVSLGKAEFFEDEPVY